MARMGHSSENGVLLEGVYADEVCLVIPTVLLEKLQAAWQGDDHGGTDFGPIVEAVRDLFDGEDGALQYLAQIGIKTIPT